MTDEQPKSRRKNQVKRKKLKVRQQCVVMNENQAAIQIFIHCLKVQDYNT